MRVLGRSIDKSGAGWIKLLPQEADDIWHLYHLLAEHDRITASSYRKLTTQSATGSVTSAKVRLTLTLAIESVIFDIHDTSLRVKGINVEENEFIKMGQYHTIDLAINDTFTLHKERWDSLYLQRVDDCSNPTKVADSAILIMQAGLAHLCLITNHLTVTKAKIELNIPKKRANSISTHDAQLVRFFNLCYDAINKHIDFSIVKVLIVASPGFIKDDFCQYLLIEAQRLGNKNLLENRGKLLLAHSSSGHKHAIHEVLNNSEVSAKLVDTKSVQEVRLMEQFHTLLMTEPDRAYYGVLHVQYAVQQKAVDKLLITDELFRSSDISTRRAYIAMCDSVKEQGSEVVVYSTQHVSGEQLAQLSGIAAILRFPISEDELEQHQHELDDLLRQQQQSESQSLIDGGEGT